MSNASTRPHLLPALGAVLIALFCHPALGADLAAFEAQPGKALVVFTRTSSMGAAIRSSVFDNTSGEPQVIGILPSKRYLAYHTEPGTKMFMIVGENADFMRAELEPDKVYFANAQVRMGAWKARFSLIPYSHTDMQDDKFKRSIKAAKPPKSKPDPVAWAEKNKPSILKKRDKFLPRWEQKPEADKAERTLKDGV